jgi:hypothetical protein
VIHLIFVIYMIDPAGEGVLACVAMQFTSHTHQMNHKNHSADDHINQTNHSSDNQT